MQEAGTRKQRTAVFLLILLSHCLIIEALLHRKGKEGELIRATASPPLLVYFIAPTLPSVSAAPKSDNPPKAFRKNRALDTKPSPGVVPAPSTNAAPAVPPIDWQAELELAARNTESEADKSHAYRNLSKSMSPAQLDWLRDHRMEPANPGIVWKKPRVEVTSNGLPIVHINDHCVLVPIYLIPMVFCSIGHIEPNGDLFKNMHSPPAH